MLTTGIYTENEFKVNCKIGEPFYLIPIGDTHKDAPTHADEKFDRLIRRWAPVKNARFFGMGDYNDLASTSERALLTHSALHEPTRENLDILYRKSADSFLKKIKPISDRFLGMLEGNHYAPLLDGRTTTDYMCDELGIKKMGVLAHFRITLVTGKRSRRAGYVDVYAHHGTGGGATIGASMNKVVRLKDNAQADVYLMGHDHNLSASKQVSTRFNKDGKLEEVETIHARTGSYLKGMVPDKASYIADRCGAPRPLGSPYITLIPWRDRANGIDVIRVDKEITI